MTDHGPNDKSWDEQGYLMVTSTMVIMSLPKMPAGKSVQQ
jgi:hypothetical protein